MTEINQVSRQRPLSIVFPAKAGIQELSRKVRAPEWSAASAGKAGGGGPDDKPGPVMLLKDTICSVYSNTSCPPSLNGYSSGGMSACRDSRVGQLGPGRNAGRPAHRTSAASGPLHALVRRYQVAAIIWATAFPDRGIRETLRAALSDTNMPRTQCRPQAVGTYRLATSQAPGWLPADPLENRWGP
jgi:hypothetical protein